MRYIFTFLTAVLLSYTASAQFTVSGTVKDDGGTPLIGASVIVKGTFVGVVTDINGSYTIDVPGDSAVLVYSFIGYADVNKDVSKSTGTVDVTMSDSTNDLDEVVVSGLATNVKRSNLANSVEYISAKELTEITTQSSMEAAMYGKFKGADLRSNSGAPGGGFSVRLRGATAVLGSKQPLYIVDGVYMNNRTTSFGNNIVSQAAGGGNQSSNQDDASNRIADLDPEDIESIEILKGSSAAAIYGQRAGNGVVIITTKQGQAGKTQVRFSQSLGSTSAIKLLGTRDWTPELVEEVFGEADKDLFNQNGNLDYEDQLYGGTGMLSTSRVTVSGGDEKTRFFFGGTYKNDDGILANTGYEKSSFRANINHQISDWLNVAVTNNFVSSTADRGFFNNSNSNTTIGYALAFTRPWEDLSADENGNYPVGGAGSNVLETAALVTNREAVNRYIGGITLNANLYSSESQNLKLIARGGLDHYALRTTSLFPRQLSYMQQDGSLGGVSIAGNASSSDRNLSAFLVHNMYSSEGINFRTQLGVTQYDQNYNLVRGIASGLNGSQTNVDQSSTQQLEQTRIEVVEKGFFVQEEINIRDQIMFTAGVRGDKSSNNGDPNALTFYPKANLAVNIHEFMDSDGMLSNLKVRAAYGQAATFPRFGDKFTALDPTLIGGQSGLDVSGTSGNPDISPQRNAELEFGADIGVMDNRILLDITYYTRTTTDFLYSAQQPSSSGFTRKIVNAGDLQNKGFEIGLTASVVENDDQDLGWTTGVNFWKNESEVTRLDIDASTQDGFATSLGTFYIQEGSSLTQIVGTFDPADCESADCSDLDPDGDGLHVYGDAQSKFDMTWANYVTWKDLTFSMIWHWKNGGEGINLSTLLYDLGGTTWDYDETTLDPDGVMLNGDYRISEFLSGSPGAFIEDAGYIRMRELGVYYGLPDDWFGGVCDVRVGASGRNLVNIFDYNSYDPEVSNFGNDVLGNAVEVTPYPSAKQMYFHLSATF